MKPQELRIGNYVSAKSPEREKWEEPYIVGLWDLESLLYHKERINIKPIYLTEEWLERLGFDITGEDDFDKTFGDIKQISIRKNKLHNTDKFGVYLSQRRIVNVKYVHQLQNLYFALTNTELEFLNQ
jgi:hypothetical protein